MQPETLQRAKDPIGAAGYDARSVEILDTDEPAAAVVACIEITSDRGQKRPKVQIPGRRGREAAYIGR